MILGSNYGRSAYESSFVKSKKPDPSDVIRFSLETTHFKAKPLVNLFKVMFGCLKEVGFSQRGSNRNTLMRGIIESRICGA